VEDAIAEIVRCSGTQFDPVVVAALVRAAEAKRLVPIPRTGSYPVIKSA
jgi:HD-GYP domain-containing protein (c-di-GMP phosphodiesterase class II)